MTTDAHDPAADSAAGEARELGSPGAIQSIEFVTPALPPVHDAIGEYTERLAATVAETLEARILVGEQSPIEVDSRIDVEPSFERGAAGLRHLQQRLIATTADAVVIQYNPFGWGRRGWAPGIVRAGQALKKSRPDVTLGVMFHETYMMNPGWKAWVMRRYQIPQYHRLAEAADVCFFSTEAWADQERERRPGARVIHLPVGSNLPRSEADPAATRERLGLAADAFVVGAFGGDHPSRRFDWIRSGADYIADRLSDRPVVILHVGGRGDELPPGRTPLVATGRLPAAKAADAIATMDVMLNPFVDGVSTRRGSAIAALQQGVPLVSTRGRATDSLWVEQSHPGLYLASADQADTWPAVIDQCLADTERLGSELNSNAAIFHDRFFAWQSVSDSLLSSLSLSPSNSIKSRRVT